MLDDLINDGEPLSPRTNEDAVSAFYRQASVTLQTSGAAALTASSVREAHKRSTAKRMTASIKSLQQVIAAQEGSLTLKPIKLAEPSWPVAKPGTRVTMSTNADSEIVI